MERAFVGWLLKYRYLLGLVSLIVTVALSIGAKNLYLESDYYIFFEDDNPQMLAHEENQRIYTKTDSLSFLIKPAQGDIFTRENLSIIKQVSDQAWQAPFSNRVDSLTNFQYSWAEGDDLIVEDLVPDTETLTDQALERIKHIALNEKQLRNRLIALDGKTTLVNVSLEIPDRYLDTDSEEIITEKRLARDAALATAVAYGYQLIAELKEGHPDLTVHLLGVPAINKSFIDSAAKDTTGIIPLMYLVIIATLALFLRSVGSVLAVTLLISCATFSALGFAGWIGYSINSLNITATIIILAIAVCDCVHLLAVYMHHLGMGEDRFKAMHESLATNLQPIVLTSLTTAVGFATLNFAASPPVRQLGNISAFGIMYAMCITLVLLPAITLLLVRRAKPKAQRKKLVNKLANLSIQHPKMFLVTGIVLAIILMAQLPRNYIDDDPTSYFKPGVPFRDAVDFSQNNLPAVKEIDFSINCGAPACVNNPQFLGQLQDFGNWLEQQPGVEFVSTYVDVIKRLNRNMHGDEAEFYRLPANQGLAAQYQLLYELSLPYGLDLNNQINFDKSATKLTVFTRKITSGEFVALEQNAQQWFDNNAPELATRGSSIHMMFSNMGETVILSMIKGSFLAIIGVTLTIFLSLRSVKYTLISLMPNILPAAMALGVWGLLIGTVNMAVASVFSITLGIVVDDTVHFICKYRRARELNGQSVEQAIHYAFSTVGPALLITTLVLSMGFGLLSLSDFNVNAYMGALTTITIVLALIFDYLILPATLLLFDRQILSIPAAE